MSSLDPVESKFENFEGNLMVKLAIFDYAMSHYDPQWDKIFTLWHTVTYNVVNSFTMTLNKVLGIFIFLKFVPEYFFRATWGQVLIKWILIQRVVEDDRFWNQ